MRRPRPKRRREPTIALINIVFLMLVFFLVAGTLSRPLDGELDLVRTADLEGALPPDTLVVHPDGRMTYRGETIGGVDAFLAQRSDEERKTVRLVPDRALPASELVRLARELRGAGAESVMVVTQRALE